MEKLLIIDGNSILNRSYYGIRQLNAPDGTPTNAVYGFLNILLKYLEDESPDYLCVAFDLKAPTFRHKMYDKYKANRKPAPDDFIVQIPIMKQTLEAMNCKCLEQEGFEADDIIGTVSRVCSEHKIECSVLTGDKDDLQLADEYVKIKLVITRMGQTTTTAYGRDEFVEKYGIEPAEFIDVKGLMGDSSDNIPGVKGIGEKTAFSLIQKYKSIENIYADVDGLDVTASVKKKLSEGRDSAFMSKTLATIDRNVPMEIDLESYRIKDYNKEELAAIFKRLSFKSFLSRLDLMDAAQAAEEEKPAIEPVYIKPEAACEEIACSEKLYYRLDMENSEVYYTLDGENYKYTEFNPDLFRPVFENTNIKKFGFDLKEDIIDLNKLGIGYENLGFDVMIAAYISDPAKSRYELDSLFFDCFGQSLDAGKEGENDVQIAMDLGGGRDDRLQKNANALYAIFKLTEYYSNELEKNDQTELYYDIELPLIEVLASMQIVGVYVDKDELKRFGDALKKRIDVLTDQIYEEAGEEFNINSPKQLGNILFDKLSLPHGRKTKTGYSTNVDILKKLIGVHPIVELIMEYRTLTKLNSTYVEGLLAVIDPDTGRIHSSFNQTVTATGRISSTEPNLQNIPVRTEIGRELRRMFVAEKEDETLVDADYSQIELRVLADMSGDENMRAAFINNVDIHAQTSSQVFGVPIEEVTPAMRTRAKAVNFGIVYGIGAFSLSQDLKITRKEADNYIRSYLQTYPMVDKFMKDMVEEGSKNGFVQTKFNRRRYLPELKSSNRITHAFGERVAMNAPIQGTAADIIKIAMVNVYRRLKSEKLRSKLILQVHDELIVEAKTDELDRVKEIVKSEMENAVKLSVPLNVDLNAGRSWYDTK